MDNTKTGALIKEVRKEKGMTQKELADLLHITDKAVSKWERGLCAPDISLLEPLSEALGVSIVELIGGEHIIQDEHTEEVEVTAKNVLDYLTTEIKRKVKAIRTKYLAITAACLIAAVIICSFVLWRGGYFFIIDKNSSPDEGFSITVYDKALTGLGFSGEDATSLIVRTKDKDRGKLRVTYGNCTYQGIWWAPDSKKYVVALKYDDRTYLVLAWLERNSESNLNAFLTNGGELAEYEPQYDGNGKPMIDYQFLQWSSDSVSMLIYYSFTDVNQSLHSGYFWYDCENSNVHAPFELEGRD